MTDDGTGVPAGWYPTPEGQQRYWDGLAWTEHTAPAAEPAPAAGTGPTVGAAPGAFPMPGQPMVAYGAAAAMPGSAQGAFPNSDERSMAMVAHLLGLVATFLGPLIIYLIKKDESPFIRDQAAEALNYSISMAIYFTVYVIVSFVLIFVLIGFFLLLLAPFLALGALAFHIVAAVKANRGEYYRYPLTIHFIK